MNPGCRVMALFLVLLALFQSLPVVFEGWHTGQWPVTVSAWVRLALLPVALWIYVRYFSVLGCRVCNGCGDDR